jgi:hypothetical protein
MKWNRPRFAGLLVLACFASACSDVGPCEGELSGRDTVIANDVVVYGGQAIINKACATGCHLSTARGAERRGVPAGLDFDLFPIDEAKADGTKKAGSTTIVKLASSQISGLRARQKKVIELANSIWQQVDDGIMPPTGTLGSYLTGIFTSKEKTPCKAGKSYADLGDAQTKEVLRNWLACGGPLVETNGAKLEKSSAPGTAGDQYQACMKDPKSVVTLETLFTSTLSECGGCHNNPVVGPPSFLDVDVLAAALRMESACAGKPFVTPGDPDNSYLLDLLKAPNPACKHDRMPAGGLDPLSDRAIAEVTAWIAAGAPTTANDVEVQSDAEQAPATVDESTSQDEPKETDT